MYIEPTFNTDFLDSSKTFQWIFKEFHTIVVSATYIIEYGYKFDNKLLFIYLLHWKLPCSI